jgi:predicted nucleotidyltransferase
MLSAEFAIRPHILTRYRVSDCVMIKMGTAGRIGKSVEGRGTCAMCVQDLLTSKREEILRIAVKHGATNVRVFGSVARGEAGPESDVDLLIELEPGRSLLDHVALLQDLEDILSRKVDVVNEKALHHRIRDRVLREATPL